MLLLNNFKAIFRKHEAIGFSVNGNQVKVLQDPPKFYETLIEKCRKVEKRIVMASLYLGTGVLEETLVNTIKNRVGEKPELCVHVLLDCMRGSRGELNSKTMLLPLINSHPKAVKVSLYHTPKYRGILKKLIPNRYNEIIGLQHMKLYLFDDDLIITGANLSNDYFTDRQDRYIVVNNCKQLADFVEGLCKNVSDFSFQVDGRGQLHSKKKHPVDSDLNDFVGFAKDHVMGFYEKTLKQTTNDVGDTTVYPLLEMGQLGIHQDSRITRDLLDSCPKDTQVHLATGYFNMTKDYANSVLTKSKATYDLLMAHPTANGFYTAKGPAGGIPKGYSEIAGRFFDLIGPEQSSRIRMFEFARPGWTFHSKGLWLASSLNASPILTFIGSPNFGERSVNHDLECQFVITTTNAELQEALRKERDDLYKFGLAYGADERQRRPPMWVQLVLFLFRSYF